MYVLQSVIVKSIERNAMNLYEARRRLLGVNEEPVIVNTTTDSYTSLGLQDLSMYTLLYTTRYYYTL